MGLPAIAAGAAIGAAGLQAYGSYESGKAQQSADQYQSNLLTQKAQYEKIAADETNATMTDRLATTLGNIDVTRAAMHTDPTSPTTMALRSRATEVMNQERAIRVGNIMAQSTEDLSGAAYEQSAGTFAMQMGELGGATDVLSAIGKTSPGTFGAPGAPTVGPPLDILNA